MARNVVDYSFSRPNLQQMWDSGVRGVVRYVSNVATSKNLGTAELNALRSIGFDVALVHEWYAERGLEGYEAGRVDGAVAKAAADALGFPANVKVRAAYDWDATPAQQGAINDYQRGFNETAGARGRGAYGGYWVIKRLFEAGLIDSDGAWQTYAWSGGNWHPQASLRQVLNGQNLAGGQVDYNDAVGDYSRWTAGGGDMSREALTREEVIELHNAYFFGNPGPGYDYHHVGGPLETLIQDFKNSEYRQAAWQRWAYYPEVAQKLTDANTNIQALSQQIKDLDTRPTVEQLKALQEAADAAEKARKKAEDQLSKKTADDLATDNAVTAFLRSLWQKVTGK